MENITKEKRQFLDKVVKGDWSINQETGLVDVDGSVSIPMNYIKTGRLPVAFGKVTGSFSCPSNQLTTLEGAPRHIGEQFVFSNNLLTTLEFAPLYVGSDLICHFNPLNSIVGVSEHIGAHFCLDLTYIDVTYHGIVIPEIEALIQKGISIYKPDEYYYPFRDAYYNSKLIELL